MKRSIRRSLIGKRIGPVNITKSFHQRGSGCWATQGFTSVSSSQPSLSSSLASVFVFVFSIVLLTAVYCVEVEVEVEEDMMISPH